MQKDHHAAVRRAKPRVHRAELRRVGEQFAARAGDSKTAGQMSHVAAFIVPESASPSGLIRSQEGSDKPGRASPRMWTHDGLMRIRHTAAADAQPDVSEVGAAAGKPWRRAPDQRTGSHGPMVQIFVPAAHSLGRRAQAENLAEHSQRGLPPSPETGGGLAHSRQAQAPGAQPVVAPHTASPDQLPISRRQTALVEMQTLLRGDPDFGSAAGPLPAAAFSCEDRTAKHRDGVESTDHGVDGAGASMTAVKVEELRMWLESQLGPQKLMEAYVFLQRLDGPGADDTDQQRFEDLLAPSQHLAYYIYKLLTLERVVFRV